MLSEGRYVARGVEAGLGMTSTGKEQVAVRLEVQLPDGSGVDRITWYGYFTEKTAERTLESLYALGWEGPDLSDLTGIDRCEVEVVIEHEADLQGVLQARVKWINAGGGLAMKEALAPDAARALAARMKGAAIAAKAKRGPVQPSAPRAQTPRAPQQQRSARTPEPPESFGDEEIPF